MRDDEFTPDWVSPPGDTIADALDERGISLVSFAKAAGYTRRQVGALIRGEATITPDTARVLTSTLGGSIEFWISRESQYRGDVRRIEEQSASENEDWLKELPLKDMIRFGWLEPRLSERDRAAACLQFFGTPNVATWRKLHRDVVEQAAYRTSPSFESTPAAVAAWLRRGEIEAQAIDCSRWDSKRFNKTLPELRALSRKKDPQVFLPELMQRCGECGVAVAVVRSPTGCRASGATRFLSPTKALLLLSFRYLSDDHFWFTFFHEAAHLILHSSNNLFLEGDHQVSTHEEQEANQFAAEVLIPPEFNRAFRQLTADHREIIRFARRVGVSPGIVVGQLQHIGRLRRNQLNPLKRRFVWL